MELKKPIIFDEIPGLEEKISWISLGRFPTPVEKLAKFNHKNLYIKRDDLSSDLYGGNKVRKLEFVLADAIAKGKTRIITMGGIGTNHGLAAAIFCNNLKLDCTLLLFPQPLNEYVKKNFSLFAKFGAETRLYKNVLSSVLAYYITQRIRFFKNGYFIYAGGSSPLGTLGFVNAVFELKQQISQGLIPEPDYIFCALGSNGTAAGLSLGIQLAGLKSQVCAVRVTQDRIGPLELATTGSVLTLMKQTYNLLNTFSGHIEQIELIPPFVFDSYFGRGYGEYTSEGLQTLKLMKDKTGIKLEPTYTAKTFAAVLDFLSGNQDKTILYWHTYNSADIG